LGLVSTWMGDLDKTDHNIAKKNLLYCEN
jgi:hypothetical protein